MTSLEDHVLKGDGILKNGVGHIIIVDTYPAKYTLPAHN